LFVFPLCFPAYYEYLGTVGSKTFEEAVVDPNEYVGIMKDSTSRMKANKNRAKYDGYLDFCRFAYKAIAPPNWDAEDKNVKFTKVFTPRDEAFMLLIYASYGKRWYKNQELANKFVDELAKDITELDDKDELGSVVLKLITKLGKEKLSKMKENDIVTKLASEYNNKNIDKLDDEKLRVHLGKGKDKDIMESFEVQIEEARAKAENDGTLDKWNDKIRTYQRKAICRKDSMPEDQNDEAPQEDPEQQFQDISMDGLRDGDYFMGALPNQFEGIAWSPPKNRAEV